MPKKTLLAQAREKLNTNISRTKQNIETANLEVKGRQELIKDLNDEVIKNIQSSNPDLTTAITETISSYQTLDTIAKERKNITKETADVEERFSKIQKQIETAQNQPSPEKHLFQKKMSDEKINELYREQQNIIKKTRAIDLRLQELATYENQAKNNIEQNIGTIKTTAKIQNATGNELLNKMQKLAQEINQALEADSKYKKGYQAKKVKEAEEDLLRVHSTVVKNKDMEKMNDSLAKVKQIIDVNNPNRGNGVSELNRIIHIMDDNTKRYEELQKYLTKKEIATLTDRINHICKQIQALIVIYLYTTVPIKTFNEDNKLVNDRKAEKANEGKGIQDDSDDDSSAFNYTN